MKDVSFESLPLQGMLQEAGIYIAKVVVLYGRDL